jgi:hypothetical protein
MVKTKGLSATQANWDAGIGRAPAAYTKGVQNTTGWQAAAIAGESLYGQKVQEAVANHSRATGISQTSDSEWQQAALSKGAQRIGPGMTAAKGKFNTGISKVLSVIEGTSIAPRSADPMANVDGRVKPLVAALHAIKGK